MKSFFLLFSIVVLISCGHKTTTEEQIIFDRIAFTYNLKSAVNKIIWKDFDLDKFDVPLIYYTSSNCYIANPTQRFLDCVKSDPVFENGDIRIYKTRTILDSIPFHMEVALTLGNSTPDYNYKSPFMNCSSLEITRKRIPQVHSTEQWATMVLHEYFHGFQQRHINYLNVYEKYMRIPEDSLKKIYKDNAWFKESIIKENDLLLKALNCKDDLETKKWMAEFFSLRKERRWNVKQTLNVDIESVEKIYETMEGTARYIEYELYKIFSEGKPETALAKSDTAFHSYTYYKNYKMEKDAWLYQSGSSSYFYASGFNVCRLLDKLKIEYKPRLFNEGETSLEQLLQEKMN